MRNKILTSRYLSANILLCIALGVGDALTIYQLITKPTVILPEFINYCQQYGVAVPLLFVFIVLLFHVGGIWTLKACIKDYKRTH